MGRTRKWSGGEAKNNVVKKKPGVIVAVKQNVLSLCENNSINSSTIFHQPRKKAQWLARYSRLSTYSY
jgi:hypothetical protein